MIHIPSSRLDVGIASAADWELCKDVYRALKEAEKKKKDDEERAKRGPEAIKKEEMDDLRAQEASGSSKDGSGGQPSKAAAPRKAKRNANLPNSGATYSGPVTRQRQRNQSSGVGSTRES